MFFESRPLLRSMAAVLLFGAASAAGFAAPPTSGQPLILDTQRGITDGRSGGVALQTAPLANQRAAGLQPGTPEGQPTNGSMAYPYVVAPYIEVRGGTPTPQPRPRPTPTPH